MKPGDVVRLVTPDNPRTHGAMGVIAAVTDWGAHVRTDATATGRFRASFAEMEAVVMAAAAARDLGYTGDVCGRCGGTHVKRNGACLLCEECGESSGCS